jgi:hypothetical protein
MKVLFLDIDGVLNSAKTCCAFGGYPFTMDHIGAFDQAAIRLIQRLCDQGVQVVLSSSWRNDKDWETYGPGLGLPIIDRTPSSMGPRGSEIKQWLDAHPEVEQYAIVDDDRDMLAEQLPRFVKTNGEEGLTFADYRKLCELFGMNPWDGAPRQRHWKTGHAIDWSDA